MLGYRLRRWPNFETTLDQSLMLAEMTYRARQQILISRVSFTITAHLPNMGVGSMLYKCIIRGIHHRADAGVLYPATRHPIGSIQQPIRNNRLFVGGIFPLDHSPAVVSGDWGLLPGSQLGECLLLMFHVMCITVISNCHVQPCHYTLYHCYINTFFSSRCIIYYLSFSRFS